MSARLLLAALVMLAVTACATAPPAPAPVAAPPTPPPVARVEPPSEPVPAIFKSDDFIVVTAKAGDTA